MTLQTYCCGGGGGAGGALRSLVVVEGGGEVENGGGFAVSVVLEMEGGGVLRIECLDIQIITY
jgi:hypothetical protein